MQWPSQRHWKGGWRGGRGEGGREGGRTFTASHSFFLPELPCFLERLPARRRPPPGQTCVPGSAAENKRRSFSPSLYPSIPPFIHPSPSSSSSCTVSLIYIRWTRLHTSSATGAQRPTGSRCPQPPHFEVFLYRPVATQSCSTTVVVCSTQLRVFTADCYLMTLSLTVKSHVHIVKHLVSMYYLCITFVYMYVYLYIYVCVHLHRETVFIYTYMQI